MDYQLRCEGFPVDDELRDRLLLCGREFVLEIGSRWPLRMAVRQVDGQVQGHVELALAGRRLSALVNRRDPETAIEAAIAALRDTLGAESSLAQC